MSLSFSPQSEEEVSNLLKAGVYDFQVKRAEDTVSKKGNPMIKIAIAIWDEKGHERIITDYLMEAMMYKLKHFCDSVGLEDKYKEGQFDADDCLDRSGKCKIVVEESDDYPAKNSVKDYIKSNDKHAKELLTKQVTESDFQDDDIPF